MTLTPAPERGATTQDGFLNGRLRITQPARGFRAGIDAVLLAAAVPARPGEAVLELGCGVGTASLCLMSRVPGLKVTGVEVQAAYAALAQANGAANGMALEVVSADLAALPGDLRQRNFDHVIANPPYFDRAASTAAADPGRDVALGGPTPLAEWIDVAARRLRPGGRLTLIQRIARLPEMLTALEGRFGSVTVRPLCPRAGRAATLFVLGARRQGRGAFHLSAPLVLHDGARHGRDGDDYSPLARTILRDGRVLPLRD